MGIRGSLRLAPKDKGTSQATSSGPSAGYVLDEILPEGLPTAATATGGIDTSLASAAVEAKPSRDDEKSKDDTDYTDRLTKLFPVEGVTLFPFAVGISNEFESVFSKDGNPTVQSDYVLFWLVLIIAVVVIGLRYFGTQDEQGNANLKAVAVSAFAFALYAATLGGFAHFEPPEAEQLRILICSALTIIFTAFMGFMKPVLPRDQ